MSQPVSFPIASMAETEKLGLGLARTIFAYNPGILLLYGPMGAGKTTLTRYMVQNLPGGDAAEIASPSFTIANIYCTSPVVHHFDLYRLEPGMNDEALEESFDDFSVLTVVEWPERLSVHSLPQEKVVCHLLRDAPQQRAVFTGTGPVWQTFQDIFCSVMAKG